MYFLGVLAIFKNEAMNLKEWLDHYIWQGVDKFYLINNGSTDNYLEVLEPYIRAELVMLFERPERYVQANHYNEVFEGWIRGNVKWLAVVDLDEFFYCNRKLAGVKTVADLLRHYELESVDWGGLYSAWKLFGSSGVVQHPCGKVRETFIHRSGGCWQPKGIVLADKVKTLHVHIHDHDGKVVYNSEFLQLNHYAIQSREYFEKIKMTRGDATTPESDTIRDWTYFARYDHRDLVDTELRDLVKNECS